MDTEPLPDDVDPRLWIELPGCAGRHYLLDGNPHTFHGRMFAYCTANRNTTLVSKDGIARASDEAVSFIRGYLSGNQPPPPVDGDGDLLPGADPRMATWRRASEHFLETGYWWGGDPRPCQRCGAELLHSEPGDLCPACA